MSFESFAHVPVTEELLHHVWEGEKDLARGGHRYGLGRLHKTEFPEHWDLEDVASAVQVTLSKPQYITHKSIAIYCDREVRDVVVRVVLRSSPLGLSIQSAYPICGSGVFRNEAQGRTALPLDFYNWEE